MLARYKNSSLIGTIHKIWRKLSFVNMVPYFQITMLWKSFNFEISIFVQNSVSLQLTLPNLALIYGIWCQSYKTFSSSLMNKLERFSRYSVFQKFYLCEARQSVPFLSLAAWLVCNQYSGPNVIKHFLSVMCGFS
jgi:hypothetical protein